MTNTWLRLWHDMPTDPKFRVIAKRSGRPLTEVLSVFVLMMTNASANATERGRLQNWSDEDSAAALDMETAHVVAIREAMEGKTIDDGALTGWEKRQPKREDSSAERAREWRERNRTQSNAEKRPDKKREDKIREEKKEDSSPSVVQAAAHDDGRTDGGFVECKSAFNGSTEAMILEVEHAMGGHCRKNAQQWLANLLRTHGQGAVAEAFQRLLTAKAEGSAIVHVLRYWDTTARNAKREAAPASPKRTLAAALAASRAAEAAGVAP